MDIYSDLVFKGDYENSSNPQVSYVDISNGCLDKSINVIDLVDLGCKFINGFCEGELKSYSGSGSYSPLASVYIVDCMIKSICLNDFIPCALGYATTCYVDNCINNLSGTYVDKTCCGVQCVGGSLNIYGGVGIGDVDLYGNDGTFSISAPTTSYTGYNVSFPSPSSYTNDSLSVVSTFKECAENGLKIRVLTSAEFDALDTTLDINKETLYFIKS